MSAKVWTLPPNSYDVELEDNFYSSCPYLVFHIVHIELTALQYMHRNLMNKLEVDYMFDVNQPLITDFDADTWGKGSISILFVQYSFVYLKVGTYFQSIA